MLSLRRIAVTASHARPSSLNASTFAVSRHARPSNLGELRSFETLLQMRWNSTAEAASTPADRRTNFRSGSFNRNQNNVDRPPTKVLYVGNLKYEITEEEIKEQFSKFGAIRGVKLPRDLETGQARGFAYVEFSELSEAAEALESMHHAPLQGRRMQVQYVNRPDLRIKNNPESRTLFIGNLSFNTTDEDLDELFKDFPGCKEVRVAMDRRTSQPRGFVHADFEDIESAAAAKKKLTGTQLYGRTIRVDFSTPPEDRRRRNSEDEQQGSAPATDAGESVREQVAEVEGMVEGAGQASESTSHNPNTEAPPADKL